MGLSSLVIIGSVIIIITPYFASVLILIYFGKDMFPLELRVILYLVGYFDYFLLIFRFIIIIIEIKMVMKLFN